MRTVVLLGLVACGEPTETGPTVLVGRLLDASGAPVADQKIESVEGRDVTDPEGRFHVEWKPPSQHADFERAGVRYSRSFREQDAGLRVDLRLPATRPAVLRCERTAACDLRLHWDLGDGLTAWVATPCPHGEVVSLAEVPEGNPVARCAAGVGPEEQAPVVVLSDGFVIQDAAQVVRVEVHAEPGREPQSCTVWVAGREGQATGDGAWTVEVAGRAVATGLCDDRPVTPRVVTITSPATVTLEWSPLGPDLDLGPWLPGAGSIVVEAVEVEGGEGGWRLDLHPSEGGVFHLPPLGPGRYRISAGSSGPPVPMPGEPRPGVFVLGPLVRDPAGEVVGLQGVLQVGADATDGDVRVIAP